jgi:hypothetical protein
MGTLAWAPSELCVTQVDSAHDYEPELPVPNSAHANRSLLGRLLPQLALKLGIRLRTDQDHSICNITLGFGDDE